MSAATKGPGRAAPTQGGGRAAVELVVTGVVQGVGFRPFVHRLALRHGLAGAVRNEPGAVRITLEGDPAEIDRLGVELRAEAPPLARIEAIDVVPVAARERVAFVVEPSATDAPGRLPVSPDVALCAACEAELFDPRDRRHGYPFITCTDCGPRFTVIESMPYDRARTSMRAFEQCPACRAEYESPGDRRYHSETNSCPACGPRLEVRTARGVVDDGGRPIEVAARALLMGRILALRGLGGFHLAVDASEEAAVRELRERKRREAKPFAVMVRTLAEASLLGHVGPEEARLLASRERPVVLLRAKPSNGIAPSVAPGLDTLGVMLAYTPLHHLLLEAVWRPLVMTSGNASDEPIAIGNEEALERLTGIADVFLLHDREIVARYDDGVVRVAAGGPIALRRARGRAPLPLRLPVPTPVPLVAVGPHLKNTFALADGADAYVSQHIGDLDNLETLEHFRDSLARFRALFRVRPERVACDMHPGYLSTRIADEMGLGAPIMVQHHHAHVAAVMAEHRVEEPVVGVAYDGTGYGDDGDVWGAEFLVATLTGYRRRGRLRRVPLAGGDVAAREPWRLALAWLAVNAGANERAFDAAFADVPAPVRALVERQLETGTNTPLASSMGRLFDAAAAVIGTRRYADYEGQAPMELESLVGDERAPALPFPASLEDGAFVLDPFPLLVELGEARRRGVAASQLAASFHESVAAATARVALTLCDLEGLGTVALGGGCFQNARLLGSVVARLERHGVRVLVPRELPPGDGGISYGQAAIAAARLSAREV